MQQVVSQNKTDLTNEIFDVLIEYLTQEEASYAADKLADIALDKKGASHGYVHRHGLSRHNTRRKAC